VGGGYVLSFVQHSCVYSGTETHWVSKSLALLSVLDDRWVQKSRYSTKRRMVASCNMARYFAKKY